MSARRSIEVLAISDDVVTIALRRELWDGLRALFESVPTEPKPPKKRAGMRAVSRGTLKRMTVEPTELDIARAAAALRRMGYVHRGSR